MAKYLVLIYESEAAFESAATRDPADGQHFTFLAEHRNVILAGEGLLPTSTATSLRRGPGGDFAVTDGPFETKEAFGGITCSKHLTSTWRSDSPSRFLRRPAVSRSVPSWCPIERARFVGRRRSRRRASPRVWRERGVPAKPAAWLTTTARNRTLDVVRRDGRFRQLMPMLVDGVALDLSRILRVLLPATPTSPDCSR